MTTMDRLIDLASFQANALPERALALARFSLFDWMVVGLAGAGQPLSGIIREFVTDEGGRAEATVIGAATRVPARAAALANGAISHALDYDDTHFAHIGHLSVGILPAALAVAERLDLSATAAVEAFLVGAEAACRVGLVLGRRHYERGFHQTATAGAFGATVAAGRLLGLDAAGMRDALSLVATRASGLKSQFGGMGKPFNAGIAAANGVEAASLAARGFGSCHDGIGGAQGFIETHTDDASESRGWAEPPDERFLFEDIKYKLHACCHGTHAMLNALAEARRAGDLSADGIARIELSTNPRWLQVCDIKAPRTGLEVKFSYGFLAAMAVHGIDTAADRAYVDGLCADPALIGLAARVIVTGDPAIGDTEARVTLVTTSGGRRAFAHDLDGFLPLDQLETGLRSKAAALLGAGAAQGLWSAVATLDRLSARDLASRLGSAPA